MSSSQSEPLAVWKFVVGPLATNCYVAYDTASRQGMLIDPGFFDPAVEDFMRGENIRINWTVNTHGHADHILANGAFPYPVAIHRLDAPFLDDPARNLAYLLPLAVRGTVKRPAKLLEHGDTLWLGETAVKVVHTPGHTPGSIALWCGMYLFAGDTLFREGIGRTDCPGGSYEQIIESLREKIMTFPDGVKVFPGHGPETDIGHERRHNPFLRDGPGRTV